MPFTQSSSLIVVCSLTSWSSPEPKEEEKELSGLVSVAHVPRGASALDKNEKDLPRSGALIEEVHLEFKKIIIF